MVRPSIALRAGPSRPPVTTAAARKLACHSNNRHPHAGLSLPGEFDHASLRRGYAGFKAGRLSHDGTVPT